MPKKKAGRKSFYKVRAINFGWYRRKHGILLENLPGSKQQLLLKNHFMKWLDADVQAYQVIFKIEDLTDLVKNEKRPTLNPYRDQVTTYADAVKDNHLVEWNCGICGSEIISSMKSKKVENFVCSRCVESHNSKCRVVDSRIIESARRFADECKKGLKKEQRSFINHVKRSS